MKTLVPLFLCLFLFSCTTGVKFSMNECKEGLEYGHIKRSPDFTFKKQIWLFTNFGRDRRVYLDEVFKKENVNCRNVRDIELRVEQTAKDVFLSFIPFITFKTITVRGAYRVSAN